MADPGWYAWGRNSGGWLGTGDTSSHAESPTPMDLPPTADGISGGSEHAAAIVGGQLYTWGLGTYGAPGFTGTTGTPTAISGMTNVVQVACGERFTAALKSDRSLWMAGTNYEGAFGNGGTSTTPVPFTETSAPSNAQRVVVSDLVTAVIDSSGQLWMTGSRHACRIPDGNSNDTSPPRYTSFHECDAVPPLQDIAVGWETVVALKTDGTVLVWGRADDGRDGSGTNHPFGTRHSSPVPVAGLSNIVAVDAMFHQCLALRNDGTLFTWGPNSDLEGGIYDSEWGPILSPTEWPMPGSATVAALGQHAWFSLSTLVVGSDGEIYGSGYNDAYGASDPSSAGIVASEGAQLLPPDDDEMTLPVNGYPNIDSYRLVRVSVMGEEGAFALWRPPAAAIPGRLATIIG